MPDTLTEKAIRCKVSEKDLYMYYYLNQKKGESCIVFCNSITCTKRTSSILDFLKIKNHCLHSKMQQRQRLKNLDRFKNAVQKTEDRAVELGITAGSAKDGAVLVCTDVAARGLDIPNVSNVLHYQSPYNAEIYVHRAGRTARIGKSGETLALLAPDDEKNFRHMCKVLEKDVDKIQMLDVKYGNLELMKGVVNAAIEVEKAAHRSNADEKAATWLIKTAKAADLTLDDDLKVEVQEKLSGKKRRHTEKDGEHAVDDIDVPLFPSYDDGGERKRIKV